MKKSIILLAAASVFSIQITNAQTDNHNLKIGQVSWFLIPGEGMAQNPEVAYQNSLYQITCYEEGLEADEGYISFQVGSPVTTVQITTTQPVVLSNIKPILSQGNDKTYILDMTAEWVWALPPHHRVPTITLTCVYQAQL